MKTKTRKPKAWSSEDLSIIKGIDIKDRSSIRKVARQLRRTYNSVYMKIYGLRSTDSVVKEPSLFSREITFSNYKSIEIKSNRITIKF